uniref:Uncharacterized protein n=1 Tax=Caenorhabditis japonica TaxID=281687 RepID=A0A8R1I9I5_CAEJA
MGAQEEEFRNYGPYSYKIHGQIYHATGPLHPPTGKALSYGQLYTMNTKQAAEERFSVAPNKNCDRLIMKSFNLIYFICYQIYIHDKEENRAELSGQIKMK